MGQLSHFGHSKRIHYSASQICPHSFRRHVLLDDSYCLPRSCQNGCICWSLVYGDAQLQGTSQHDQSTNTSQPNGFDQNRHSSPSVHSANQLGLLGHFQLERCRFPSDLPNQNPHHCHLHGVSTQKEPQMASVVFADLARGRYFDHSSPERQRI